MGYREYLFVVMRGVIRIFTSDEIMSELAMIFTSDEVTSGNHCRIAT